MDTDDLLLHSGINASLLRYSLFRGTILAGIGLLFLFFAGVYFPLQLLKVWGPIIFFFAIGLITWGLLPYRRLKQLEVNPYIIHLEKQKLLHFSTNQKRLFTIPLEAISTCIFIPKFSCYGIGVNLKSPLQKKVVVFTREFNFVAFRKHSQKNGCDLFFLYFSRRSYELFKNYINSKATCTLNPSLE